MSDDKPETIPGARLVAGVWQDLEGNPLSNADLMHLRQKAAREREQKRREKAKKEAGE